MRTMVHVRRMDGRLRRQLLAITSRAGDLSGRSAADSQSAMVDSRLFGSRRVAVVCIRQELLHRGKQNAEHDEDRGECATKSESECLRVAHDGALDCRVVGDEGRPPWPVAPWTLPMGAFAH